MIDVLLVVPPSTSRQAAENPRAVPSATKRSIMYMPSLGVAYLAAVIEKAGYSVRIVDIWAERLRASDLAEIVQQEHPRVVGISTSVTNYKNGLRLAEIARQAYPVTRVIVGGPQASFLVEETLACFAVDIVVRFEGEETILELMQHFDQGLPSLENIKGIAFRTESGIHTTERRPLNNNLDSLPSPAYHLIKMENYEKPSIITGRGCPYQCVFCAANALYQGAPYRARSPQKVVEEIATLVQQFNIDTFFVADDTFTMNAQRVNEICDLLIARNLNLKWGCEARINIMTRDLAKKLFHAGCQIVQYGVETGNAEIMELVRKNIKLDQVEDVIDFTLDAGLDVLATFIIGLPWDTQETVRQTIAFGRKIEQLNTLRSSTNSTKRGKAVIGYSLLTPLPGTYIYEHAEKLGIRFLTRDWDKFTLTEPVIETKYLTAQQIRNLYIEATQQSLFKVKSPSRENSIAKKIPAA